MSGRSLQRMSDVARGGPFSTVLTQMLRALSFRLGTCYQDPWSHVTQWLPGVSWCYLRTCSAFQGTGECGAFWGGGCLRAWEEEEEEVKRRGRGGASSKEFGEAKGGDRREPRAARQASSMRESFGG